MRLAAGRCGAFLNIVVFIVLSLCYCCFWSIRSGIWPGKKGPVALLSLVCNSVKSVVVCSLVLLVS